MTLRELYERATGGEWHDIPHPKYESASHRIATRADQPWENFNQIAYAGKNDAALIVALHNCAEELLNVVEAARAVEEHGLKIRVDDDTWAIKFNDRDVRDWFGQVTHALAALREKEEKV